MRFLYAAPDRVRYKPLGDQGVAQIADGEFLQTAFGGRHFPGGVRYSKTPVAQMRRLPHLFRPDFPLAGGDDPFLFIGIVAFGGFAYYWFVQRHKTGVLDSHRLEEIDEELAATGHIAASP